MTKVASSAWRGVEDDGSCYGPRNCANGEKETHCAARQHRGAREGTFELTAEEAPFIALCRKLGCQLYYWLSQAVLASQVIF